MAIKSAQGVRIPTSEDLREIQGSIQDCKDVLNILEKESDGLSDRHEEDLSRVNERIDNVLKKIKPGNYTEFTEPVYFNSTVTLLSAKVEGSTDMTDLDLSGNLSVGGTTDLADVTVSGTTTLVHVIGSTSVALTNATPTIFVTIGVPTGDFAGGEVIWTVYSTDATDFQAAHGTSRFAAVNKAGTVTTSVNTTSTPNVASAGTLTTAITAGTSGNNIELSCNANSSLTPTTLDIHFIVVMPKTNTVT